MSEMTGNSVTLEDNASPDLDDVSAPLRVIELTGVIGAPTVGEIHLACRSARLDPAVELVVFAIDSICGVFYVADAIEAIYELGQVKRTASYVEYAVGSSLLVALACNAVVANPVGEIGQFGFCDFCADQAADIDNATKRMLATMRPGVAWDRLRHTTVHGEQAEAMGIVDALRISREAMLARFTFSTEAKQ